MTAVVVRDWASASEGQYWNAYVGDTISFDRLTVNVGLRWDRSASSIAAASVPASKVLPNLLPALDAPAVENAIVWNTVTPRVGVTYALNESRKTIARASYSMFASQLDANRSALIASAIPYYSYVYYRVQDTNGNRVAASRSACDLGWFERKQQIGTTGLTVSPKLYIACGISGAFQHVSGMRGAQTIVAINTDVHAPIFQVAHYCVVEDLTTFIPVLLEELSSGSRGSP